MIAFLMIMMLVPFTLLSYEQERKPSVIRAQYIITEGLGGSWKKLLTLKPAFKKYGLVFVDRDPDVILCNHLTPELAAGNTPVIIFEKRATASIGVRTRKVIGNPVVKAVFKNRVLKVRECDNQELVKGTYFLTILEKYFTYPELKKEKPNFLSSTDLDKIMCVPWDLCFGSFNPKFASLKNSHIDFDKERPVDVFFVGSIQSAGVSLGKSFFYGAHRTKAIEEINKIKGINAVALAGKKVFSFEDYIQKLQSSKIVVSPWGFGEWCFRDEEAMHCGAVLIKPDTDFVQSIPDIYHKGVTYVACKPDFSDLPELVNHILKHYSDYVPMRKRAKHVVQNTWELDELVKNLVHTIRTVLASD